ncbi:hypothetical protein V7266_25690 [Neobacillus drentensis]|uniref:hypothetical protein n=1 Tax=Neobacillus drentensis TaxID=220684 RepID=UPI00300006F1
MNKNKIIISFLSISLLLCVFSTSIFAESKKQLEVLVMEHEMKIGSLEQTIKNLQTNSGQNQSISTEVKQALLSDLSGMIENFTTAYYEDKDVHVNVVKSDIVEKDGKIVLQIFTEGNYNWTSKWFVDSYGNVNSGPGYSFGRNLIYNFDSISKMYGVNLNYEFYQNGDRVNFTNN